MGKHRYGVILDAGSSGSRVYVYRWLNAQVARKEGDAEELASLPELKTHKKWRKKVHPGISTFGDKPELVGPEHLQALVEFALEIVPENEVTHTPIFLLATAGMRLLPETQQAALLQNVCAYFQKETRFQLPDCGIQVQVIPGETEGLYGWIAANYLLGGFDQPQEHDHGKGHHTYGFLDMGGASAQIAFAPNATEAEKHANDLKLLRLRTVGGESQVYKVFVTTWLGFGANEARRRYVDHLLESYPSDHELPDPCLPAGLLVNQTGAEIAPDAPEMSGKQPYLLGTGSFAECLRRTYPLLEKDMPCEDSPCLLNGQHTPALDFDVNHFVGVSEYWHTTHELFAMAHKDKAYDFHTYQKQVTEFCSRDWTDIVKDVEKHKWGKNVDEKTVEEVCFKASWLINVLHEGIGIPRVGIETEKETQSGMSNKTTNVIEKAKDRGFLDPFQAVDKIDGTEVSWTLGKMVLYASSQMPPATKNDFAVGFGSNVPGVRLPMDFQHAGGKYETFATDFEEDSDKWSDRILTGSYARRVPGILIFLLILILAVYLLCGRERRLNFHHKILSILGRRPGTPRLRRRRQPGYITNKLFGDVETDYERVLEDADSEELELSDVISEERNSGSSAEPHRTGRSSGWATPANRAMSPDFTRSSPKHKGYFDSVSAGSGHGLGITPFERGGLSVRTESKERLSPKEQLSGRSRTGSPKRSPLLTPMKESVE